MPNPRLADAASPYLRQHADDPVEWYVWGEEAFAAARDRDVPVFLSSGYSACHGCHVMQAESFRDPDTARVLNEDFVPVKVDRELRPDVDALYMDYVTATTGRGGWPMSVFLAPDLTPLLGATYLPSRPLPGVPMFLDVLREVGDAYRAGGEPLDKVLAASMDFLRTQSGPLQEGELDRPALDAAAEYVVRLVDRRHGGFGDAPKFPQSPVLLFLCAYYRLNPDEEVVWVVSHAVSSMLRGGIYDQAGGGLFRYSTDAAWTTPHFEKMLYDNGQLLSTLAAASGIAQDAELRDEFGRAARQTAAFLDREMALPDGGFAASLSADQAGVEGGAYLWTYADLARALSPAELAVATAHLGADPDTPDDPRTLTRRAGRSEDPEAVDAVLAKILTARASRTRPDMDDKLVTAWNALAARGLLDAGAAFGEPGMTSSGLELLDVLMDRCATPTGVLRVPEDPSVAEVRLIEDAALLASACITAYESTTSPEWLDAARRLHGAVLDAFVDGGDVFMAAGSTGLPVRPREQGDEPTPSGTAATIDNAVRLSAVTGDVSHLEFARAALRGRWMLAEFAPEHAGRALEAATRLALLEG